MKKVNLYILLSLTLVVLSFPLEGASNAQPVDPSAKSTPSSSRPATNAAQQDEYYNIMKRDQIDNTNVLAIPLDDSEIEDEEEINRDEHKETFPLPHSR